MKNSKLIRATMITSLSIALMVLGIVQLSSAIDKKDIVDTAIAAG